MAWVNVGGGGTDCLGELAFAGETGAWDLGEETVNRRALGRWRAFGGSNNFSLFLTFTGSKRRLCEFY